ncbi:ATPase/histidine kinase/DNA gyrase B/HSP90 domain protein [uncultured Desulfatiglans sp.]|uniref:histidine kinase n=1 Tax=Uncultured Desulfatiglans sp. TaxID=1748965 RepID=A0A653A4C8_UNCDX|nr:ATPase/histidine kinase/DNA gyrase B/HSP90 domain protein [uncultured Desulfatiglans sp.]
MHMETGTIVDNDADNARSKLNLLLVEDDEDDYVIIRELLSQIVTLELSLDWITGWEEAAAALESGRHDLCLLDYRLGIHDGLELLGEAQKKGWKTPVIFLTGQGEYEVDVCAMRLGAADYLVKDHLTTSLLERSLRYALERETSRKALQEAYNSLEARVQEKTADLAAANMELQRESERIKLFAYSVYHDLKNPAISIYGIAKRLLENYEDGLDDKGRACCRHLMKAAQQIATLTEMINMFIAAKEVPMNIEELDLKKALACIREGFSEQLESRHIKWSEPEHLPVIRADEVSLGRIFRNLVDNALKYGGSGLTEIRIGYRETGFFHILSVNDDGIGIKTDNPDKVFGPFTRTWNGQKAEGVGLGLAIVKEIADRHNGEVWIEPGALGGASISVSFPKWI